MTTEIEEALKTKLGQLYARVDDQAAQIAALTRKNTMHRIAAQDALAALQGIAQYASLMDKLTAEAARDAIDALNIAIGEH